VFLGVLDDPLDAGDGGGHTRIRGNIVNDKTPVLKLGILIDLDVCEMYYSEDHKIATSSSRR